MPILFPGQVGHILKRAFILDMAHQIQQWLFGRITSQDEINIRIADGFLVEIGGRQTAQNHGNIGVEPLAQRGKSQRPVRMRRPVKADPESQGLQFLQQRLRLKAPALRHLHRQVDDAHREPIALQMAHEGDETERKILEGGRSGHRVTHRPVAIRPLPKIHLTGRMQQYQMRSRHVDIRKVSHPMRQAPSKEPGGEGFAAAGAS